MKVKCAFEIKIVDKNGWAIRGHNSVAYTPTNLLNCFTPQVNSAFLSVDFVLILKDRSKFSARAEVMSSKFVPLFIICFCYHGV